MDQFVSKAKELTARERAHIVDQAMMLLEGFYAHAEQANVRVRRYGGRNVGYAQAAE